jgi:predicted DNA-binding transcriptional regulator YafY
VRHLLKGVHYCEDSRTCQALSLFFSYFLPTSLSAILQSFPPAISSILFLVPRNAEVIRQWTILREIERSRGAGVTIDELASLCSVTTRTIRRDLQALEESGFPLFDDKTHDDGKTRWRVNGQAFKGLSAGLTVSELCALYFSRTLLESLSGTPFRDDVESAFEKLSSALTPHMRQFLDQLPRVIATKADPMRRHDNPRQQQFIARALEATLQLRQANLTYHSKSSERTKTYLVHPYRLAYAQGGLYLLAYVPEYHEVRTFAVERIQDVSLLEERFTPIEELPDAAFPHSLGVHSGPPERVELEFEPAVADYVRAREWHPSQQLHDSASGGLVMALDVCLDRALHSWILSFGPFARVLAPAALAREIAEQFEEARARYAS